MFSVLGARVFRGRPGLNSSIQVWYSIPVMYSTSKSAISSVWLLTAYVSVGGISKVELCVNTASLPIVSSVSCLDSVVPTLVKFDPTCLYNQDDCGATPVM